MVINIRKSYVVKISDIYAYTDIKILLCSTSVKQENDENSAASSSVKLSTPDDPPVKAFYFPDESEETASDIVTAGYDSNGNGLPVASHWDTFYAEKNVSSVDVHIREQVATAPASSLILIIDK